MWVRVGALGRKNGVERRFCRIVMRPTAYRCGGFRFVGSVIGGDTRESGHASEKIGTATLRSPLWKLRATVWKTAASALTSLREMALQQLTSTRGLPNAEQVVQDHSNCGLDCGLRRQRPTPLPFEAPRRKCYEVFGASSPNQ